MVGMPVAEHLDAVQRASAPVLEFIISSRWSRRQGFKGICDFVFGNPHEPPLSAYVEAIRKASVPQGPNWFGYTLNQPPARVAAAQSLCNRLALDYSEEDIFLTRGASGALILAFNTIINPGDEVIVLNPPWFFYNSMITFARGVPVRARVDQRTFDVDVDAVRAAITPRTKAIILNTPNNPTGKIYPLETLQRLSKTLMDASKIRGEAIYLISDECYSRILFEGSRFVSPTAVYPYAFLVYSYAKNLLTPGQRLGYLAISPHMPERERVRRAVLAAQYNNGYALPDAVLQHALPEIEPLCIDVARLQRRRDRFAKLLRQQGYNLHVPEGTWYLVAASPVTDDRAFVDMLADEDVFVLPGHVMEMPGYFRISLTASDEMVERAIPRFAAAISRATNICQESSASLRGAAGGLAQTEDTLRPGAICSVGAVP